MKKIWLVRLLIFGVAFWNLQCAAVFLIFPERYAPSFELNGEVGLVVIRAMAVLFVMWNIPYLFALIHPYRWFVSLIQALVMQSVGFIGETWLFTTITAERVILRSSILRFMIFDGLGILLLGIAVIIALRFRKIRDVPPENSPPDREID